MHAAIFREYEDPKSKEAKVFRADERLSFDEALRLYTSGAAFAASEEDRIGALDPGMKADFIVIDKPIWHESNMREALKSVEVQQVWVDGQRRYAKGDTFEKFYQHREQVHIEFRK